MEPALIRNLIEEAVNELQLDVTDADAQPGDGLGDVRATSLDGTRYWFEVKAQTTKDRFRELTQADWVRDETDFLRWIVMREPTTDLRLPYWARERFLVDDADNYFEGWDRDSLWMADLALLVNRDARKRAGVYLPGDLIDFFRNKYLLHLTREGVRVSRLDTLAPAASYYDGEQPQVSLNFDNQAAVSIALRCPGRPRRGSTHFTYHVAYPTRVLGRHKLHSLSVDEATPTLEIVA